MPTGIPMASSRHPCPDSTFKIHPYLHRANSISLGQHRSDISNVALLLGCQKHKPLWWCSWLYQRPNRTAYVRAESRTATPWAQRQAALSASLIAHCCRREHRAAAVQIPPILPAANASARQRSSVETNTPISRATTFTAVLPSGNNNRASTRSLNACPYRANVFVLLPGWILSMRQLI